MSHSLCLNLTKHVKNMSWSYFTAKTRLNVKIMSPNFRNVMKLCIATLIIIKIFVFPLYLFITYNDICIILKQNITYHHQVYILYIIIIVLHYTIMRSRFVSIYLYLWCVCVCVYILETLLAVCCSNGLFVWLSGTALGNQRTTYWTLVLSSPMKKSKSLSGSLQLLMGRWICWRQRDVLTFLSSNSFSYLSLSNREEKERATAYKRKGLRPRRVILRVWVISLLFSCPVAVLM